MLSTIGKSLVVLVAVLSVAFMATTIALSYTSPPFEQRADELDDYSITINPATETTPQTFTGVSLATDEQLASNSEKLPNVVVALFRDKVTKGQARLAELQAQKAQLDQQLQLLEQTVEPDRAAMEAKVAQLRGLLAQVRQQKADVSAQIGRRQEDVESLLQIAEARRSDVYRTEATLQQAQAAATENEQLVRQLQDLVAQLDGDLQKARSRRRQLENQLDGQFVTPADQDLQSGPALEILEPEPQPET